jgi:hypothetical protein
MTGMRNYYGRERGHLAVLDQAVVQRVSMDARGISAQYGEVRGAAVYAIVGGGDV